MVAHCVIQEKLQKYKKLSYILEYIIFRTKDWRIRKNWVIYIKFDKILNIYKRIRINKKIISKISN